MKHERELSNQQSGEWGTQLLVLEDVCYTKGGEMVVTNSQKVLVPGDE